jgi:hypothetical protein
MKVSRITPRLSDQRLNAGALLHVWAMSRSPHDLTPRNCMAHLCDSAGAGDRPPSIGRHRTTKGLAMIVAAIGALTCSSQAMAQGREPSSTSGAAGAYNRFHAQVTWAGAPTASPWLQTRDVVSRNGFTAPGLFILPEVETAILFDDDPLGYRRLGVAPFSPNPLTGRLRLGWVFGSWTVFAAARGSLLLGTPPVLAYSGQAWNAGGEIGTRFTLLSGSSWQPFISVAVGAVVWSLPLIVSRAGNAEQISGELTPLVRAGLGVSVRLASWFYLDIAAHFEWMSAGSMSGSNSLFANPQLSVTPSLGFTHYLSSH